MFIGATWFVSAFARTISFGVETWLLLKQRVADLASRPWFEKCLAYTFATGLRNISIYCVISILCRTSFAAVSETSVFKLAEDSQMPLLIA